MKALIFGRIVFADTWCRRLMQFLAPSWPRPAIRPAADYRSAGGLFSAADWAVLARHSLSMVDAGSTRPIDELGLFASSQKQLDPWDRLM